MSRAVVTINRNVVRLLHMQALESYPLEVSGILFGNTYGNDFCIRHICVTTIYKIRTRSTLVCEPTRDMWEDETLGISTDMEFLGGFHTHPEEAPTLSMPSDVTKTDRTQGIMSDFEELEDGCLEWITGLWPRSNKKWRYEDRCYTRTGNRRYILEIDIDMT